MSKDAHPSFPDDREFYSEVKRETGHEDQASFSPETLLDKPRFGERDPEQAQVCVRKTQTEVEVKKITLMANASAPQVLMMEQCVCDAILDNETLTDAVKPRQLKTTPLNKSTAETNARNQNGTITTGECMEKTFMIKFTSETNARNPAGTISTECEEKTFLTEFSQETNACTPQGTSPTECVEETILAKFTPETNAQRNKPKPGFPLTGLRLRNKNLTLKIGSPSPLDKLTPLTPQDVMIRARGHDNRFLTRQDGGTAVMQTLSVTEACSAVFRLQDLLDEVTGELVTTVLHLASGSFLAVNVSSSKVAFIPRDQALLSSDPDVVALHSPSSPGPQDKPFFDNNTRLPDNSFGISGDNTRLSNNSTRHIGIGLSGSSGLSMAGSITHKPYNHTAVTRLSSDSNTILPRGSPGFNMSGRSPKLFFDSTDSGDKSTFGLRHKDGYDDHRGDDDDFLPPHPSCLFKIVYGSHGCIRPAFSPDTVISFRPSDGCLVIERQTSNPWKFSFQSPRDACRFLASPEGRRTLRQAALVIICVQSMAG